MENIKNLPNEIQHKIESYARNLQPKELMLDIRSFTSDFGIVQDCYFIHYNDRILLYDLIEFCRKKKVRQYIHEIALVKKLDPEMYNRYLQYISFEEGDVIVSYPSIAHVPNYVGNVISKELKQDYSNREIVKRIRELWGLFSPSLRTKFINDYILIDELEF
jgi:hypothetical protein